MKTFKTNTLGTINLLESLRGVKKETISIIITSDKSYKNIETKKDRQKRHSCRGRPLWRLKVICRYSYKLLCEIFL